MKHANLTLAFILLTGIQLSACSNKKPEFSARVEAKPISPKVVDLTAISTLDRILPRLQNARVVSVGETHTNYSHHLNQLAVIKALHSKWGNKISIGLEMVQRPFQQSLDGYIAGEISEREMLRRVEWYDRWKYDFRLYRPIFNYAKDNKIPLVALNIPKELSKRISKVGIDGLNAKERSQLPKSIDRSNVSYEKRLKKVYRMHAHAKKSANGNGFKRFVDAQLAWDEGMAMTAAKYLTANLEKNMVLLAGEGHLVNREGIPRRIDRQLGIRSVVVLNQQYDEPSSTKGDYLLFASEKELPATGMFGISMEASKGGVLISGVSKKSAAAKAGLTVNDVITKLDKFLIKTPSDVSLWRFDKKPGTKVMVAIRRGKQHFTKSLILGKPFNHSPFSMSHLRKK